MTKDTLWWLKDDCCGVFCGFFTPSLIFYACFVQLTFVISPYFGFFHPISAIYICATLLAAASHAKAQFTNPGAVPLDLERLIDLENTPFKNADANDSNSKASLKDGVGEIENRRSQQINDYRRYCNRCRQQKPFSAHHCSICNRCIIRMDHHCPWVNNCVAFFNQKYFLLFLCYTALCCILSLILLVWRFVHCSNDMTVGDHLSSVAADVAADGISSAIIDGGGGSDIGKSMNLNRSNDWSYCNPSPGDVMCCVMNLFEAILFGLFTCIMGCDQIASIANGTTYIDSMQGRRNKIKKSSYECMQSVFGEPFGIGWFLPTRRTPKIKKDFLYWCTHFDHGESS